VELLLVSILFAVQSTVGEASPEPQALWTEWLGSWEMLEVTAVRQDLRLELDLEMQGVEGEGSAVQQEFRQALEGVRCDLLYRIRIASADRLRLELQGSFSVVSPDEQELFVVKGCAGLLADGETLRLWADGTLSKEPEPFRGGASIRQATAESIYAEILAMFRAAVTKEPTMRAYSQMVDAAPPTLMTYLHPRNYWLTSAEAMTATRFEVAGDAVRVELRIPEDSLQAYANIEAMMAEPATDDEEFYAFMRSLRIEISCDRTTGWIHEMTFRGDLLLQDWDPELQGSVAARFTLRSELLEWIAPSPEEMQPPEGLAWFDLEVLVPLIRMLMKQSFPAQNASDDDLEF